jgi:serine/threonine protein phosphatase PrpC
MATAEVAPPTEVSEESAEGPVKQIYADIKDTLRVPIVNLVFRTLATHPDYLQLAWNQLKPNARIALFERSAGEIRRSAVEAVVGLGQAPRPEAEEAIAALKVFHYVNPKLLLAVAALRASTSGQYPKVEELPDEDKRQTRLGAPDQAVLPPPVDPSTASERVSSIFADIRSTLDLAVVNSDYRALANWPDYLERAWNSLKPITQLPEYDRMSRDLKVMAEETALVLPFRMETNPYVLRLCGLSEDDIDEVRGILDQFYRLLPGLILNIAFLTIGAIGREAALASLGYPEAARMGTFPKGAPTPAHTPLTHRTACATHIGRTHSTNQDAGGAWTWTRDDGLAVSLLIVADGVSSGRHSEAASRLVVDRIHGQLEESLANVANPMDLVVEQLVTAARSASQEIADRRQEALSSAGATTLVAAVCIGDEVAGAWIGDSRIYLLSADGLSRLSRDHSWAEGVVSRGIMSEEQAALDPRAHMITRWLGPQETGSPDLDTFRIQLAAGDVLLCCSDGLYGYFSPPQGSEKEMAGVLKRDSGLQERLDDLVAIVLERGGHDDITAAAVQLIAEGG